MALLLPALMRSKTTTSGSASVSTSPSSSATRSTSTAPINHRPPMHHFPSTEQRLLEYERMRLAEACVNPSHHAQYNYPTGYAMIPGQPVSAPGAAPLYYAATPVYAGQPVYQQSFGQQAQVQPAQSSMYVSPQGYVQQVPQGYTPPQLQSLPQYHLQQPQQSQAPALLSGTSLQPLPSMNAHPQQQGYQQHMVAQQYPHQIVQYATPPQMQMTLPVVVGPPSAGAPVYSTSTALPASAPRVPSYAMPGKNDAVPPVIYTPAVKHNAPAPASIGTVKQSSASYSKPKAAAVKKPKEDLEDGWEMLGEDSPSTSVSEEKLSDNGKKLGDSSRKQGDSGKQESVRKDSKPAPSLQPLSSSMEAKSSASSSSDSDAPTSKREQTATSKQLAELELDTDMYIAWNDLKLGHELGAGNFGAVYEATWRRTTPVAAKMLHAHLKGDAIKNFSEEAKVWLRIPYGSVLIKVQFYANAFLVCHLNPYSNPAHRPHPNIVQFFGLSHSHSSLVIITELLEAGSLLGFLQDPKSHLSMQQLLNISKTICAGMWHLHCASIVHRDLAARNILVGGYLPRSKTFIIKVSDFGLSRHCVGTAKQRSLIPFKWSAPESISKSLFSTASDVWSMGVVLSEVFSQGEAPYSDLTEEQTVARVKVGYRMPKPLDCPIEVYDIILSCWKTEPSERPSMQELCALLDQLEQRAAAGQLGVNPVGSVLSGNKPITSLAAPSAPHAGGIIPVYIGANAPATSSCAAGAGSSFGNAPSPSSQPASTSAPGYIGTEPAVSSNDASKKFIYSDANSKMFSAPLGKKTVTKGAALPVQEEKLDQRGYIVTP